MAESTLGSRVGTGGVTRTRAGLGATGAGLGATKPGQDWAGGHQTGTGPSCRQPGLQPGPAGVQDGPGVLRSAPAAVPLRDAAFAACRVPTVPAPIRASAPPPPPPWEAAGEGSDGSSETPTSSVTLSEEEEGHRWWVGDACSIAWAGDGLLYPAWLQALDPAIHTCLVQFDGYGNTEERALANLLLPRPTAWGATYNLRGKGLPSSCELPPGLKRRKGEQAPCSSWSPKVMPPAQLCAIQEEEEALATMLMAWYMSGYHTSFYIGLREGQPEAAESPSEALLQVEASLVQLGGQLNAALEGRLSAAPRSHSPLTS